jgi:hypothetical protein
MGRHMQVVVTIRLYAYYEYEHDKKRWNNEEIFIENKYVNRKLKGKW